MSPPPRQPVPATDVEELLGGRGEAHRQVEAWFLGPRAENAQVLERLVVEALRDHVFWRRNFHPGDPVAITEHARREPGYAEAIDRLDEKYRLLLADLKQSSPFFSMRYQGHMIWDQTLPGVAAYFAALLYNPNNVAPEASPATTRMERLVGEELCGLVGFPMEQGAPPPWAHLCAGGTTANIEALWVARNLKVLPLALREAARGDRALAPALALPAGDRGEELGALATWPLLNLPVDQLLALPARAAAACKLPLPEVRGRLEAHSLQALGWVELARRCLADLPPPVVVAAGSSHYSLAKAAALLGLGARQLLCVPVDEDGRLELTALEETLRRCREERRAVLAVVATLGSTEEGAVDPLEGVLALRDRLRREGMEFLVHVDAAWGAYFASLLRAPPGERPGPAILPLSRYVQAQLAQLGRADTVTVDPHKTGYLPYPAGAICYRRRDLREAIAFAPSYLPPVGGDGALGRHGIEGSRPGAAAAAVHLSHAVIPLDRSGYGKILARALYSCRRFLARLVTLARPDDDFVVVPLPRLHADPEAVRREIVERSHEQLLGDPAALALLAELGPDLNILTYAFNFRPTPGGPLNTDLEPANALNRLIFEQTSVRDDGREVHGYRLLVSMTELLRAQHGDRFFDGYRRRLLGVDPAPGNGERITVLRSVVMDPWIAEDRDGHPFLDTLVDELRAAAQAAVVHLRASGVRPRGG